MENEYEASRKANH